MKVSEFEYKLPDAAIAQTAVEPRHSSRLLDTRDLSDHTFIDLPQLLSPGDLIVVNDTRVRSARLVGHRLDTGGKVELLLLDKTEKGLWEALARPSRRLRPGVEIEIGALVARIESEPDDGLVLVSLQSDDEDRAIEASGSIPLPPYFNGELASPDRYQTMYAETPGSAAAPTAGLHFTDQVIAGLRHRDVRIATVDLHVSLDTFRPMSVGDIDDHLMHSEWCRIPEGTAAEIERTRDGGGAIVAVGTTVVRTLESMSNDSGTVSAGECRTDLFLKPGSPIRVVDTLITNFHMPRSTLLVLLAAFMGDSWRTAYRTALSRGYRFLSFGDAMLAVRHRS
ncbi:MAG: tRNA preQ1(34) S-adenosylmethionine ribosyltransferase-isomerase QueA [Acidimicrobiia bacterium]